MKLSCHHIILWSGVRRTNYIAERLNSRGSQMLSWPLTGGVGKLNSPDEGGSQDGGGSRILENIKAAKWSRGGSI